LRYPNPFVTIDSPTDIFATEKSIASPPRSPAAPADRDYLARGARARKNIDRHLAAAGWVVQDAGRANVSAGPGVVVREFVLEKSHGRVDYLLFLDGQPAGVIEAKPEGTTLVEVERQSGKYVDGLPSWMKPPAYPLPFIYESTGAETRFTNGCGTCQSLNCRAEGLKRQTSSGSLRYESFQHRMYEVGTRPCWHPRPYPTSVAAILR
jgi:type I site-specific restriction endonuclease